MPTFSPEQEGQFKIDGVVIEQTLLSSYDPYSGIDLTKITSCDHIEVMTLAAAATGEQEVCDDPFASNAPRWFGGVGGTGRCKNFGTINFRTMGVLPNGTHSHALGYGNWVIAGAQEPFEHITYGTLGPAFWGYEGIEGDD